MARIQKTKMALRQQRDALQRYERFVPTLELKKKQLKMEVMRLELRLEEKEEQRRALRRQVSEWVRLFAEDIGLDGHVEVAGVSTRDENIAGVDVQLLEVIEFAPESVDLFETPAWTDDGIDAVKKLTSLEIEIRLLESARSRLAEELRITTQRVNLFQKVKIPECEETIRIIQIALGDEQIASVARAKSAKKRILEVDWAR